MVLSRSSHYKNRTTKYTYTPTSRKIQPHIYLLVPGKLLCHRVDQQRGPACWYSLTWMLRTPPTRCPTRQHVGDLVNIFKHVYKYYKPSPTFSVCFFFCWHSLTLMFFVAMERFHRYQCSVRKRVRRAILNTMPNCWLNIGEKLAHHCYHSTVCSRL